MVSMLKRAARKRYFNAILSVLLLGIASVSGAIESNDADGVAVWTGDPARRIVSLVPAVTEILFEIGAGDQVVGVTYHDTQPEAALKSVAGGFFSPAVDKILALKPDVVMVSSLHQTVAEACTASGIPTLYLDMRTLGGSFDAMVMLGRLVDRQAEAEELRTTIRQQLGLIRRKVNAIPERKRLRTLRLMGRNRIMSPGDDSFQNELIAAAGGIPPVFDKSGPVVEVSLDQWRAIHPQVVYGCYGDQPTAEQFLRRPGWKDVAAVQNGRIYYFPCALTCRAGAHTGDFVAWLSARLYGKPFSKPEMLKASDQMLMRHPLALDLPYVRDAAVVNSRIFDFIHKTLLIGFTKPMTVVSTLDGVREGVTGVGNHFFPPPAWSIGHEGGLDNLRSTVCKVLQLEISATALLFTGADMDHLSVQRKTFRRITVYALVTAGARSNAIRAAKDEGRYYEPGTINIVLLTNAALTPRAMQRAVIAATEAKSAVLQDLDIRSSYTPAAHGATGTGTDNVIVVQGTGVPIDNSGGHTRMGEMISRAVYDGVREALFAQSGFASGRNVLQRLKERKISIRRLLRQDDCPRGIESHEFAAAMERVLLEPQNAAFIEAAFAVSDDHEAGLIGDLSAFRSWAHNTAEEIAGTPIEKMKPLIDASDLPETLFDALNAVANGIRHRQLQPQE